MKINFEVKMTTGAMYDFQLYHSYHKINGYLGPVLGTVFLIYGFSLIGQKEPNDYFIWLFFGILFYLFTPLNLYLKAKTQAMIPMFKEPLHYQLDEQGITLTQKEESAKYEWKDLYKAVSTKKSIILYTTKNGAFILPKNTKGLKEEYENVLRLIFAGVPSDKVKIKS